MHPRTHIYRVMIVHSQMVYICGKMQVNELLKAADEGEKRRVEEGMYIMSCWRVIRNSNT